MYTVIWRWFGLAIGLSLLSWLADRNEFPVVSGIANMLAFGAMIVFALLTVTYRFIKRDEVVNK